MPIQRSFDLTVVVLVLVLVVSLPNIVRVVKSRRMRWAGHVARMGEERGAQGVGGEA